MPSSRAIIVLGMHRSGTSLLTRGLQGLGVFLGDDFLGAQPDNPTGYWENRITLDLNERLLAELGLSWESISLIEDAQWQRPEVQALSTEAAAYLQSCFMHHSLWGFKDPRTIRLLPFWRAVFHRLGVDDRYVVAIRNPLGVATSLLKRQGMAPATSHMLSLVYVVPYLNEIAQKAFVVTDYDLFVADPRGQLARMGRALKIPAAEMDSAEIEHFATRFVDPGLRHGYFSQHDFDTIPVISPLAREAYLRLYQLATDQHVVDGPEFWRAWKCLRETVERLIAGAAPPDKQVTEQPLEVANRNGRGLEGEATPETFGWTTSPNARHETSNTEQCEFRFSDRSSFLGKGIDLFVMIGAQRTGTTLLREILNTNEQIATLGEILSPSSAPAHWDNFLCGQPADGVPTPNPREVEKLLDQYFQLVLFRIRNHWAEGAKSRCRAFGVDIKYNQLRHLAPVDWSAAAPPFLLGYLKSRGATLIHTTRSNVIHCAISAMIATERNVWHNYEGVVIDRRYSVDVERCLRLARTIVSDRHSFLESVEGCKVVESRYEDLTEQIARSAVDGEIPDGPGCLQDIAKALGVPFCFRYDGRLRKAIDIPYSRLLLNQEALSLALKQSEFSAFAATLE
jgi:hypothetical protein